jgi:xanthine dehydrogenase accessory factor
VTTPPTATPPRLTLESAIDRWLDEGRPFAEATIVATSGAAPVPVGGRLLIAADDDFLGSVSGGCVEADVIALALDVIADGKPRMAAFGIGEDRAWQSNLPCGATIRVFVTRPQPAEARANSAARTKLRKHRQPAVLATDLTTGARRIYDARDAIPAPIASAFASGRSTIAQLDGNETFLDVLTPPPRIVAIGATHVAQILEAMATAAGYEIVVIDPRAAFTSKARFTPEAAITGWPEDTLALLASDAYTAIVTLTHIGQIDDEALKIALRARCRYVGALGSRRTHASRVERLKKSGFSDAEVARIHAPVGLDLGGREPGEIAVAILAEIVAAFNRRPAP